MTGQATTQTEGIVGCDKAGEIRTAASRLRVLPSEPPGRRRLGLRAGADTEQETDSRVSKSAFSQAEWDGRISAGAGGSGSGGLRYIAARHEAEPHNEVLIKNCILREAPRAGGHVEIGKDIFCRSGESGDWEDYGWTITGRRAMKARLQTFSSKLFDTRHTR